MVSRHSEYRRPLVQLQDLGSEGYGFYHKEHRPALVVLCGSILLAPAEGQAVI